jgi:hypothetical protein
MVKFTVSIECGNEAFGKDVDTAAGEVASILYTIPLEIMRRAPSGKLYDAHKNVVGEWRWMFEENERPLVPVSENVEGPTVADKLQEEEK